MEFNTIIPPAKATTSPHNKESLDCPHPKDILFPIFGYQLWAGNVRFIRLIKSKREDFENAATRAIQAAMAIKIMEAVEKDGGRFLTSVETPDNEHAMIVCTTRWRRLSKKEILTEIIRFLKRQDTESLREAKKARRMARRKVTLEKRRILHKELIDSQKLPNYEDTEEYQNEPKGPIKGPLMTLYYVPPFTSGNVQVESEEEERQSVAASDNSTETEEERPKKPKPSARKILPKKKTTVVKKKPPVNKEVVNPGHFSRVKRTKSREAAEVEGILDLPKGVTVRPSGKWVRQRPMFSIIEANNNWNGSKLKHISLDNRDTLGSTRTACLQPKPTRLSKNISLIIATATSSRKILQKKNWPLSLAKLGLPPNRLSPL